MPGLTAVLDPDAAPLELTEGNGFNLLGIKAPAAQSEKQWASNIDTEGQLPAGDKTSNLEISTRLRITGKGEKQFRERQVAFEQKINKLQKEGGTLRILYPDGSHIDWEVRAISGGERLIDNRFFHAQRTEDEITFVCGPFGKGEEELVGEYETTSRVLECVIENVKGSADALARAVVTSPSGDVWDLKGGRDSRHYSAAATAKALYAASALTPLGGATSTTATVDGKAGTSVVRQGTLTPNWTAMLSTQITGVGQMTHEGIFEVLAWVHMPAANTGAVAIGWDYAVGDLAHRVEGERIYFDVDHAREGKVIQLSLGHIFLEAAEQGSHLWEGRIIAKSTVVGDVLDVLDFGLRPLEEASWRVGVNPALNQPTALTLRDEFNQGAGNLNEKVLAGAGTFSGPKSAGTGADDATVGTVAWTNPGNITVSDDTRAVATLGAGAKSHYLKATKFGFAIPAGATIDGIVVEVERSNPNEAKPVVDNAVRIVKGGAIQATDRSSLSIWPTSDAYYAFGAQTDLWGATWANTDINAEGFGVAISAWATGGATEARIDHIRITIYYTDAGGQKWTTSGDAVDLAVETTGHTAQRSEVSDASIVQGRYAVAGTTVFTDQVVGISCKRGSSAAGGSERVRGGVLARYVDENNWLFFGPDRDAPSAPVTDTVRVIKRVSGTVTELGKLVIPDSSDYRSVWLHVDRRGRYLCWGSLLLSGLPRLLLAGQDNDLATGGALDDGKAGFYDAKTGATANTRNFNDFVAWIPPLDAAIYSGLSLELAHDRVEREALGGGIWGEMTPEGDYMRLSPAGIESRQNRLVFIASPNDPDTMGVGFPSKLKVAIYATPRYRTIPDPA